MSPQKQAKGSIILPCRITLFFWEVEKISRDKHYSWCVLRHPVSNMSKQWSDYRQDFPPRDVLRYLWEWIAQALLTNTSSEFNWIPRNAVALVFKWISPARHTIGRKGEGGLKTVISSKRSLNQILHPPGRSLEMCVIRYPSKACAGASSDYEAFPILAPHCRTEGKRPMNLETLPNFLRLITNFLKSASEELKA